MLLPEKKNNNSQNNSFLYYSNYALSLPKSSHFPNGIRLQCCNKNIPCDWTDHSLISCSNYGPPLLPSSEWLIGFARLAYINGYAAKYS